MESIGSHSHKLLLRPSPDATVNVTVGAAVLKLCGGGRGFTSYFCCRLHFLLFAATEGWKTRNRVRNRKTGSFTPSMAMNVSFICILPFIIWCLPFLVSFPPHSVPARTSVHIYSHTCYRLGSVCEKECIALVLRLDRLCLILHGLNPSIFLWILWVPFSLETNRIPFYICTLFPSSIHLLMDS